MRQFLFVLTALAFLAFPAAHSSAATGDNVDRKFILGFLPNLDEVSQSANYSHDLIVTSEQAAFVNVAIPDIPYESNFSLPGGGGSYKLTLPSSVATSSQAVLVNSSADISVVGLSTHVFHYSDDSFLVLPESILGNEYYVLSYQPTYTIYPSHFLVVVRDDNTTVTVTTAVSTTLGAAGTYDVALNRAETLKVSATLGDDLTGTRITSDRPVAVFSGTQCAWVPVSGGTCDTLVEQMIPVSNWADQYLVTGVSCPFTNTLYPLFRIISSQDGNMVNAAGNQVSLDAGQYADYSIANASSITGVSPISVAKYSNDTSSCDPYMVLQSSPSYFINSYFINVPAGFAYDYITVAAENADTGTCEMDSVPMTGFTAIDGTGYSSTSLNVTDGIHTLTCPNPFGAEISGYDASGYGSYAHMAGINFAGSGSSGVPNVSSGGGGGCFIATAAYGSYMAEDVMVLRKFRDRYMLKSDFGRKLVAFYYNSSPPIAGFIAKRPVLRTATRAALAPIVYSVKHPDITLAGIFSGVFGLVLIARGRRLSKKS